MPLYEYACEACRHRFEVIQRFSDAPVEACPVCGGRVRKLQSAPAFQFKGTGWYVTDYAKSGGDGAEGAKDEQGGAKPEGKGEVKASEGAKAASEGGSISTPPASKSPGPASGKDA
jgi:putative FmdB family regulatory protein